MQQSLYSLFVTFFFVSTLLLSVASSDSTVTQQCVGQVFDGLLAHEVDFQVSTNSLSAHWTFSEQVVRFDWAAVSQLPFQSLCADTFRGLPDVFAWQKQTLPFGRKEGLSLAFDSTYYIVVRAVLQDGRQIFIRSNGLQIVQQIPTDSLDASQPIAFSSSVASLVNRQFAAPIESNKNKRDGPVDPLVYYPHEAVCPYNEANRCRQLSDRTAIARQLDEMYGDLHSNDGPAATVFRNQISLARQIVGGLTSPINPNVVSANDNLFGVNLRRTVLNFGDTIPDFLDDPNIDDTTLRINARQVNEARDLYHLSFDDEEDSGRRDLYEWIIAPGIAGIILFLFIILVVVLVIVIIIVVVVVAIVLCLRGLGGGDSGSGYAGGDDSEPDDPSAFNRRQQAAAGSTDDKTNVEFPDTEIRRLSITHEDNAPASTSDGPKRKHPIMESSSSSFRDFRSANV